MGARAGSFQSVGDNKDLWNRVKAAPKYPAALSAGNYIFKLSPFWPNGKNAGYWMGMLVCRKESFISSYHTICKVLSHSEGFQLRLAALSWNSVSYPDNWQVICLTAQIFLPAIASHSGQPKSSSPCWIESGWFPSHINTSFQTVANSGPRLLLPGNWLHTTYITVCQEYFKACTGLHFKADQSSISGECGLTLKGHWSQELSVLCCPDSGEQPELLKLPRSMPSWVASIGSWPHLQTLVHLLWLPPVHELLWPKSPSSTVLIDRYQHNVNPSGCHMHSFQTLQATSPFFQGLPDAPRPSWCKAICSQTLQEHSQTFLNAPAVMEIHSGCYEIWLIG